MFAEYKGKYTNNSNELREVWKNAELSHELRCS